MKQFTPFEDKNLWVCPILFQVGKILGGLESHIIQEGQQSHETQSETKSMESSHSDPSKDIRPSGSVMLASKCILHCCKIWIIDFD